LTDGGWEFFFPTAVTVVVTVSAARATVAEQHHGDEQRAAEKCKSRLKILISYFMLRSASINQDSATVARAAETVTTTVTAVGKKNSQPPSVKKEDVDLYQGRERMQVANWRKGETLFLAVLIDDSLDQTIASQWNECPRVFHGTGPGHLYRRILRAQWHGRGRAGFHQRS